MSYCNNIIIHGDEHIDHFFPKYIFSNYHKLPKTMQKISKMIKNNKIKVCGKCNMRKSSHLFWSIESVRDFIKSNLNYRKWLLEHFNDRNFIKIFMILPRVIKINKLEFKNKYRK